MLRSSRSPGLAARSLLLRRIHPIRVLWQRGLCALAFALFLSSLAASPASSCRFWALIGNDYPEDLLVDHLQEGTLGSLKSLGGSYRDGWGIASFPGEVGLDCLQGPLIRRGRPQANWAWETEYDLSVAELDCLRPRAAMAHVRSGGTGHWGLPDPHPFLHERFIFVHNGELPADTLVSLLTEDELHYLQYHPTEYVNGYIDSELYLMYLLKIVHQGQGTLEESLVRAINNLAAITQQKKRMNFALTAGDTLYALRYGRDDADDPLMYCRAANLPGGRASSWYVVSSEIVGSSSFGWASIPERTFAVFVPGEDPRFTPITGISAAPGAPGRSDEPPAQGIGQGRDGGASVVPLGANPTTGAARFRLDLPGPAPVVLTVMTAGGRRVRRADLGSLPAGAHEISWDGLDGSGLRAVPGQYFCTIEAGDLRSVQRVTLLH